MATAALDFTTDEIVVTNRTTVTGDRGETLERKQDQLVTLEQFRTEINTDPTGLTEVKVDTVIDFTDNETKYINVCTIPAGSKVKLAIIQILTTVVGGGTTVKLGLGPNAGDMDQLGKTAALTANSQVGAVPTDALGIIATQTVVDLNGVTTAGTALGDTNVTAGTARVIIIYDKPKVLADV